MRISRTTTPTIWADRDRRKRGKKKGGGLTVLINNRWCNPGHITVKDRLFSPDIELLAVGLSPHYLPREFSHSIMITVVFHSRLTRLEHVVSST